MPINDAVESIIAENKITIFSKSWCPYSRAAKATLAELASSADIKILELDQLEDGPEIQDYLLQKTGQRTVPNVFVRQMHLGGNDQVQAASASGALQKLLAE